MGIPESNPNGSKPGSDQSDSATPEDVATLYSWANLHGAKYRDFSASRAQAREEARLRVEAAQAEERRRQQEEAERIAQEEAQLAARLAAEAAEAERQAEAERLAEIARQAEAERQAVLAAQEAQRQAALQRAWQPDPPEVAPSAYESAFVMPETHPSNRLSDPYDASRAATFEIPSQPQATSFPQMPVQANSSAATGEDFSQGKPAYSSQPGSEQRFFAAGLPGAASPYSALPEPSFAQSHPKAYPEAQQQPQQTGSFFPAEQQESRSPSPWHPQETRESRDYIARPAWLALDLPPAPAASSVEHPQTVPYPYSKQVETANQVAATKPTPNQLPMYAQPVTYAATYAQAPAQGQPPMMQSQTAANPQYAAPETPKPAAIADSSKPASADDTFLGSRDRLASRWFALKSVFDPQSAPVEQLPAHPPARVPALAVFSLAGGVGKTSLVASLGRALSARGERVLLVDTAAYGLLPFFFGARDQRPGMLRTFNPPGVSADAPIQLVTIDPESQAAASSAQHLNEAQAANPDWLADEVVRYTSSANRVLIDLPTASGATTRRILRLSPVVLVPVLADMNSVVSVGAIESFFRNSVGARDSLGKPILPYYVLNQFDYSLPLHLDVREILREQIGDRLLPFALRRSAAVSEALAEGMTVMDYAPTAVVAEDYSNLAAWVRSLSAPATQNYRGVRWSER